MHYLGDYFAETDQINSLLPHAQRLMRLRQLLLDALPEPLGKNATVVNYRQGRIIIYASNAAIAAKLKLLRPALMTRLTSLGLEVTGMDIGVQPESEGKILPPKHAVLSDRAREALAELASQLPESELKSAVSTLAGKVGDR